MKGMLVLPWDPAEHLWGQLGVKHPPSTSLGKGVHSCSIRPGLSAIIKARVELQENRNGTFKINRKEE